MIRQGTWTLLCALGALGAALTGCGNPSHSEAVDALGGEVPGIDKGPLHRAGQPCLTCHSALGPGQPVMSVAGTLYTHDGSPEVLPNAVVRVVSADGVTFETKTNCAGNFFVRRADYVPVYPVLTAVTSQGYSRVMLTEVRRDGSCNDCHTAEAGPRSPGRAFVLPRSVDAPVLTGNGDCASAEISGTAGTAPACDVPSSGYTCPTDGAPSYATDVAPVLAARCVGCHSPEGETPTRDLTTRALVKKLSTTVQTQILSCIMPPPPLTPLTEAERRTVMSWLACNAPDN